MSEPEDKRTPRDVVEQIIDGTEEKRSDDVTVKLGHGFKDFTIPRKMVEAMAEYERTHPGGIAGTIEANSMKLPPDEFIEPENLGISSKAIEAQRRDCSRTRTRS